MHRNTVTFCLIFAGLLFANCGEATAPAYQVADDTLYLGSLHYARSGCADCHGPQWDGAGPGASQMRKQGLKTPGFAASTDRTAVDYFKSITMGTERMPAHTYQQFTDRARWAMAHFLFSLSKPSEKQLSAMKNQMAEVRQAYELADKRGYRRWELGYQPAPEREGTPDLDELMRDIKVEDEFSVGVHRALPYRDDGNTYEDPGAALYANNCARCHGLRGEGATGDRFGLVDCPKRGGRKCGVFLSTQDFRDTESLSSLESFRSAHGSLGGVAQGFRSMSSDEWNSIYVFVKNLAGGLD